MTSLVSPFPRPIVLVRRLLFVAWFLVLSPTLAAQQRPSMAFLEGTHVFRRILHDMNMEALTSFEKLKGDPAHTILIVHGDPRSLLVDMKPALTRFVEELGGALLFASDQNVTDRQSNSDLLWLTGFQNVGTKPLTIPAERENASNCYRSGKCPLLLPCDGAQPDLLRGAGVHGTRLRVATNLPSFLNRPRGTPPGKTNELAELPAEWLSQELFPGGIPRNPRWAKEGPTEKPLFAAGGDVANGRVLLLADHSLFINAMMIPDDNNNVEFAINCLEYLRGDAEPFRNKVLFIEEGRINSNFNVPVKDVPRLPQEAIRAALVAVDDHLGNLEDENTFNRAISNWMTQKEITSADVARNVLAGLTILLLVYGCTRFMRLRGNRSEPGLPLLEQAVPAPPPQSALGLRHREMLRAGNLWENARRVARAAFVGAGVEPGRDPGRPPWIAVPGGWWQRRRRTARIRWLWRLAFDPRPVRVWPSEWSPLTEELEQLRADLVRGTIQLGKAA